MPTEEVGWTTGEENHTLNGSAYIRCGGKFTAPHTGKIDIIYLYGINRDTNNIKIGLYTDVGGAPSGAKIGTEVTFPNVPAYGWDGAIETPEWHAYTLTGADRFDVNSGTTYWICYEGSNSSPDTLEVYFDVDVATSIAYISHAYADAWPATLEGATTASGPTSIKARLSYSGTIIHSCDWDFATGTSQNALICGVQHAGAKWHSGIVDSGAGMSVTASPPAGWPTPYALKIDYTGQWNLEQNPKVTLYTDGRCAAPEITTLPNPVYYRFYFYSGSPIDWGEWGRKFLYTHNATGNNAGCMWELYNLDNGHTGSGDSQPEDPRAFIVAHDNAYFNHNDYMNGIASQGAEYDSRNYSSLNSVIWPCFGGSGQPATKWPDAIEGGVTFVHNPATDNGKGIIAANTVYCVELAHYRHSTDGYIRVWLNGDLVINACKEAWGISGFDTDSSSKVLGGDDGLTYHCIYDHTSTVDDRPGMTPPTANWATYWALGGASTNASAWVVATNYGYNPTNWIELPETRNGGVYINHSEYFGAWRVSDAYIGPMTAEEYLVVLADS